VERPTWAPPEVDITRPAAARIYDVFLGGSHNFAADREVAAKAVAHMPELPSVLRENRRFLWRAVRKLAGEFGIRQFLDLGSGIPTVGNVHEIAQQVDRACRVVYVDIDPIAVTHARAILAGNQNATAVQADFRHPLSILQHPDVRDLLDLRQPMAVLLVAALHFIPDDEDPASIVAQLRDVVAPGSYLAISHASDEGRPPAGQAGAQQVYARADNAVIMRSKAALERFVTGWELIEPGLVRLPLWHPDEEPGADAADFPGFCAIARKP
jgi:SAM-dependent methyltransferase